MTLTSGGSNNNTVRIGDVSVTISPPIQPYLVPAMYLDKKGESQDALRTLRFLLQKDALGQDVYLIGPPGPIRRRLAKKFAELTRKQVELVTLSQDTTETDLKQRREISKGTARYVDCAATRAAIEGSLLIVDGVEKTERNVLVILNNLLENREMALEDGRFLVSPKRYDELLKQHSKAEMDQWRLVRTSDKFRVIALGLPVPRYAGSALDPPFRSRFQSRDVQSPRVAEMISTLQTKLGPNNNNTTSIKLLVQAAAVLREMRDADGPVTSMSINALPEFPQGFDESAAALWSIVPTLSPRDVTDFVFPYLDILAPNDERLFITRKVLRRFGIEPPSLEKGYDDGLGTVDDTFKEAIERLPKLTSLRVVGDGGYLLGQIETPMSHDAAQVIEDKYAFPTSVQRRFRTIAVDSDFVPTSSTENALARMMLAHCAGLDICLFGEKGGGKTRLVRHFARLLNYGIEHIPLYKDVSARQLLQRRATLDNGDTVWEDSPLVVAALLGKLAVLDSIEQIVPGTAATLQELVCDRELRLPDGRRLVSQARFERIMQRDKLSKEALVRQGVEPIHPDFRIVACGRPQNLGGTSLQNQRGAWLAPELCTMFAFVHLRPTPLMEQSVLLRHVAPMTSPDDLERINKFTVGLRDAVRKDDMLAALESTVSIRQMVRVCRRLSGEQNPSPNVLRQAILGAALDRFLPPMAHDSLISILDACGIISGEAVKNTTSSSSTDVDPEAWRIRLHPPKPGSVAQAVLQVGPDVFVDVLPAKDPLLVPNIVFFDNPRQSAMLAEMLRDWKSGQHLLLIGNQGVGKNKLADRMLQLLQLPREYIQLHRDTTVQNLTSNPTIVDGRLIYEDSPLVRAAREGRVLVVDEADKAPTYVTAVLKGLVEDRSMLLSDGRRIVDARDPHATEKDIAMHPDFRVIALANRPGFPFHGNDFFREVGDVFSCHAIDNPDAESELYLMLEYGRDVPIDVLKRLISAFDELRSLSDAGKLAYPYSTRELAAIVKHMQRFPKDGVDRILRNVFDFDNYHDDERETLSEIFAKHGIPFSMGSAQFQVKTGHAEELGVPRIMESWQCIRDDVEPALQVVTHDLAKLARFNHGSGNSEWNLRNPDIVANMNKISRSAAVFTEERYQFRLPRCSVIGATSLPDGRLLVAARSASMVLFVVDAQHEKCLSIDLFASLPADGTYRSAPRLADVVALAPVPPSPTSPSLAIDVVVCHQDIGFLMCLDLNKGKMLYLDSLPGVVVSGAGRTQCLGGIGPHSVLVYQRGQKSVGVIDFMAKKMFCVGFSRAGFPGISDVHILGAQPRSFLVTDKSGVQYLVAQSKVGFDVMSLSRFDSSGKRIDVQVTSPRLQAVASTPIASSPPGGLKPGMARFARLDSSHSGFITGAPDALLAGRRAHVYEFANPEEPRVANSPIKNEQALFLGKSDLWVVVKDSTISTSAFECTVNIYDVQRNKVRVISVNLENDTLAQPVAALRFPFKGDKPFTALTPAELGNFSLIRHAIGDASQRLFVVEHHDGQSLITIDCLGNVRVWYVEEMAVRQSFDDWRKTVGRDDDGMLKIIGGEGEDGEGDGQGKGQGKGQGQGKGDGDGDGEGDGQGKGQGNGTGEGSGEGSGSGRVSAGGGGGSGRGRGKTSLEEVSELPDPDQFTAVDNPAMAEPPTAAKLQGTSQRPDDDPNVMAAAKEMKKQQFDATLQKLGMTEFDAEKYKKYQTAVRDEIRELRSILDALDSKDQERIWSKNQQVGDLDDQKLVDGMTGERAIYKRRKEAPPDMFFQHPKRLSFVFDVSMSMSRYASDGRLERSLEAACMVMESLKGFERKFDYRVSGHSGDTDSLILVPWSKPPSNDKTRLDVLRAMHAHTEMCDSGDTTLEAARKAIFDVAGMEADDRFVFLVSDANLQQYSITPEMLARIFSLDKRVHVFLLFIASPRDSTAAFVERWPSNVFVCLDKKDLPRVLKKMFQVALRD